MLKKVDHCEIVQKSINGLFIGDSDGSASAGNVHNSGNEIDWCNIMLQCY